jgi:iron(III) transport system substrate-binding protein
MGGPVTPWYRCALPALVLVSAVLAGGCGGSPSSPASAPSSAGGADKVLDEAGALSGQQQVDFLLDAAKKEDGPLRLYTSYSKNSLDALVNAFEQKYGLDIASYRAASEAVSLRVHQETQARYADGADFVEMRGLELHQMDQEGLIRAFHGDFDKQIPAYSPDGSWTADRLNVIAPCWNTDLVPPGQQPTSWQDLADPRWKGRIAIEQADDNWFETLHGYLVDQGMSDQQADDYFRAIVANGKVVKGHTEMQTFVAAGQYAVGADCYTYVTEGQKADGAHTDWQPAVNPPIIQPNGVAVMKTAAHPASAALFYRWILTEGQDILAKSGNTAVTKTDVKHGIPLDIEGYAADANGWSTRYENILGGR